MTKLSLLSKGFLAMGVLSAICWADPLSKQEAESLILKESAALTAHIKTERVDENNTQSLTFGPHTLRWKKSSYGAAGKAAVPLWISLHGGGEVPTVVNDQQWSDQAKFYQPSDGLYVAPRAPTDTWFMWNESHIDPLLDRLIENLITFDNVDPDKVYLLGYSAGGNGVYHLASRMADRFAAAAAMAGYPSGAPIENLRNLPFGIYLGRHDTTFDRVSEGEKWQKDFLSYQKDDPSGYQHIVQFYPDYGHWMHGKESEALSWMARFTREPWPKRIVWKQDAVPHRRFYWVEILEGNTAPDSKLTAIASGQVISIQGKELTHLKLWLSDALLDLDQPVEVIVNGKCLYRGPILRSLSVIQDSLKSRLDVPACATAALELKVNPENSAPSEPNN